MNIFDYKFHKDFIFSPSVEDISGAPDFHIHDGYEMIYLISGKLEVFIEKNIYAAPPGSIVLIPSEAIHKTVNTSADYRRIIWNFTDKFIDDMLKEDVHKLFQHPVYMPDEFSFMDKFVSLFKENQLAAHDSYTELAARLYMQSVFIYLIRNRGTFLMKDMKATNPTVERLIRFVHLNYTQRITLEYIAKRLNLTPNYLSALLFKNTGMHFNEYLNGIRIRRARRLLHDKSKKIADVAHECGFSDSNYFSTVFKSSTGLTPIEYRRININNNQ